MKQSDLETDLAQEIYLMTGSAFERCSQIS